MVCCGGGNGGGGAERFRVLVELGTLRDGASGRVLPVCAGSCVRAAVRKEGRKLERRDRKSR